ncbi:hypothetical protein SK128_010717, partial [Halocaridina rubra]
MGNLPSQSTDNWLDIFSKDWVIYCIIATFSVLTVILIALAIYTIWIKSLLKKGKVKNSTVAVQSLSYQMAPRNSQPYQRLTHELQLSDYSLPRDTLKSYNTSKRREEDRRLSTFFESYNMDPGHASCYTNKISQNVFGEMEATSRPPSEHLYEDLDDYA